MTKQVADAQVRTAWAADADAIARVQVRAWRETYAALLPPDVLDAVDEAAFATHWHSSLQRPPDARHRVLVALEGDQVVGFAATGPSDDPDADAIADGALAAFHIDPDATGRGHGSRLLNACVETLRSDGFVRTTAWLFAADDAMRSFLGSAGWAPDGAHRELDLHGDGSVRANQIRLHTQLPSDVSGT